ncbi:MAG: hypothetical protein V1914_00930 [archaeon]
MIKPEEILLVARDTINQFPHKINKPLVQLLPKKTFSKFLSDSGLKKHLKYTPAFVAHLPERDCVCFCPEIINDLMRHKQKDSFLFFVQALTLHELFHIKNAESGSCDCCSVESEALVHRELSSEFPEHAGVLDSVKSSK